MTKLISGIHHITALADEPQKNIDFYTGILGLRLVKKTVNFDAPETYHFYYGNETGEPGTILTFFPYPGIPKGRRGKGMLNFTMFSLPTSSIRYWENRMQKFNIDYKDLYERFDGEVVLSFEDPDGLGLELVFNDKDARPGFTYGQIPQEFSIKGFFGAEIREEGYERTAGLLMQQLDHELIAEKGNRFRFATADKPGNYIDIICSPDSLRSLSGAGTVHHIAFCTGSEQTQAEVRNKIAGRMLDPTPVIDRQYFKSVYFREPGGVLFEVATLKPGFTIDENPASLGKGLKLPPQYEQFRDKIQNILIPVNLNPESYR